MSATLSATKLCSTLSAAKETMSATGIFSLLSATFNLARYSCCLSRLYSLLLLLYSFQYCCSLIRFISLRFFNWLSITANLYFTGHGFKGPWRVLGSGFGLGGPALGSPTRHPCLVRFTNTFELFLISQFCRTIGGVRRGFRENTPGTLRGSFGMG